MRAAVLAGVIAGLAAQPMLAAEAAKPAPAAQEADAELLEFLGSLDEEDEDWRKYLEERPIQAAAGKPAPPTQVPPREPAKPVEVKKK